MKLKEFEEAIKFHLAELLGSQGVEASEDAARAVKLSARFIAELTARYEGQRRSNQRITIDKAVQKAYKAVERWIRKQDNRELDEYLHWYEEEVKHEDRDRVGRDDTGGELRANRETGVAGGSGGAEPNDVLSHEVPHESRGRPFWLTRPLESGVVVFSRDSQWRIEFDDDTKASDIGTFFKRTVEKEEGEEG